MSSDPHLHMLELSDVGTSAVTRRPCRHAVFGARILSEDTLRLTLRLADWVSVQMDADNGQRGPIEELVRRVGNTHRVEVLSQSARDDLLEAPTVDLVMTDRNCFDYVDGHNTSRQMNGLDEYNILILPPDRYRSPGQAISKTGRPFRLVSVGGTFNTFHPGHEDYLRFATTLADSIHIFIATDRYAAQRKRYNPRLLRNRRRTVANFLNKIGCGNRVEIDPLRDISDIQKYVIETRKLDIVVAERAYVSWFAEWNDERISSDLEGYMIMCRPRTTTPDGNDIASSLWARGARNPARQRSQTDSLFEGDGG